MSIKIKKCPVAESKEDFLTVQAMHASDVQKGCAFIANKIIEAGINHDYSKIPLLDNYLENNIAAKTGDEFKNCKWYQAHINAERHHLNARCPDDVNLIDVIELLVDCVMASIARRGNLYATETADFISMDILEKAFKNTVEMLKNEIVLEKEA